MSGTLRSTSIGENTKGTHDTSRWRPNCLKLDELGKAHTIGDGTAPAGLEDNAWLAQANCPEIAITAGEDEIVFMAI